MKQCFNIIRIETSRDMSVGNRTRSWEFIDADNLTAGKVFDVHRQKLTVVSIDENEMEFTYYGKSFRINRYWQVLGTPEFGIPNERISVDGRFVFFFGNDNDMVFDWSDGHTGDLVEQMNRNNDEGYIWKNIPLVREIIHEFKDVAPFRSESINPVYKAHYIACMLENDYVDKRETPRLFHSLCELYRLYLDFKCESDYDEYLQEHFDRYYFRQVDSWIYKFAWIADNPDSSISRDCWERSGGMLKVDPVQASPEWEDIIYEVEKEVDEQLKDEPRGMGFCFSYWSAKRAALARHGIQWRSPSEMNPRVMFD